VHGPIRDSCDEAALDIRRYAAVIERTIATADVVLVLVGRGWLTAVGADGRRRLDDPQDLHRREVASALKQSSLLIPVLLDGVAMPSAATLPDDIAGLAGRNAVELSDSRWEYDVSRLASSFERRQWLQPRTVIAAATALMVAVAGALFSFRVAGQQPAAAADPTVAASISPVSSPQPVELKVLTSVPAPTAASGVADPTGATCVEAARTGRYNPDTIVEPQSKDWSAAGAVASWLLQSFGCDVPSDTLYDKFVPAYIRPELGLLDMRGTGIVAVFQQLGLTASSANLTFDEVSQRAGRQPLMIGSINWANGVGHLVGVRRLNGAQLTLANTETGPTFGQQQLDRAAFDQRAPMRAICIDLPEQPTPTVPRRF